MEWVEYLMRRTALTSLLLLLPLHAAWAGEPDCTPQTPVDTDCTVQLADLHPTQPSVGLLQVEDDIAELTRKEQDGLKATRKKRIPLVIGPDGRFYLTDRHHLSSALWRMNQRQAHARIIGHLQRSDTFWQDMQARHWVWLEDARCHAIRLDQLPATLAGLVDNPYRALAGYAQDKGWIDKTDAYFMEFQWACYLGKELDWAPLTRNNLKQRLKQVAPLMCAEEAKALPGYRNKCPD